jgi:hypothetical protein
MRISGGEQGGTASSFEILELLAFHLHSLLYRRYGKVRGTEPRPGHAEKGWRRHQIQSEKSSNPAAQFQKIGLWTATELQIFDSPIRLL